jgi:hypothetical protein
MTNFKRNLMLAAAACTIAAGSAAAQTYQAEIPFTFRAGATTMAPGHYQISLAGSTSAKVITVRDLDKRNSIMVQPSGMTGEQKGAGTPKLGFECANTHCTLASLWVGGYEGAYRFHTPRLARNETARVETIGLTRAKGD